MKLNAKEVQLLDRVLDHWEANNFLDEEKVVQLKKSYQSDTGDYKTLSFYAFFAAISCALLAFGALVLDEKWIERMRNYFSFSEFTIALLFAGISVVLILYIRKRKQKYINAVWANESLSVLLGLSICVMVTYIGKGLSASNDGYYWLIFAVGAILGIASYLVNARVLWLAMIVAFTGWFAAYTYETGHPYWLGMNMPLRLFLWSALLLLIFYFVPQRQWWLQFKVASYFLVWIMFLSTAWGLSVFGNVDMDRWFSLRQFFVLPYAVGFTVLLAVLLWWSIKRADSRLRDMILLFFILNIYTRYFEYLWDITNKGIFFAIMALSFWFLGRKLEQWRRGANKA
jgi:MFS family permease